MAGQSKEAQLGTNLQIPITKGKSFITVNTGDPNDPDEEARGDLTPAVFREALIQGMKVILNRGMSKITKEAYAGNEAEMAEAAMKKAMQTFNDMREDKIRFTGEKVKKAVSGEVMTEARNIARKYVKAALKADGKKLSAIPSKEITAAANEMIAENPEIIDEAKKVVAARNAMADGEGEKKIDLKKYASKIKEDPKKLAEIEKEKEERKAASSAAKAGKLALRPKARPEARAH